MTRILFHRNTPWQSAIRCSTNIFAKLFIDNGHSAAYMQGVVHAGHILAKRGRWESWAAGPRHEHGAFVFTPLSVIPYSQQRPFDRVWAAHASYRSCIPSIRNRLQKSGFGIPEVIWTANPGSSVLKQIFPESRLIFQVVDYYPAFSGSSIREIERIDYEAADHIFVIGHMLKNYIVNEHGIDETRITVLGQGVFLEKYQQKSTAPPEDIAQLPRPIGVWVGVNSKGDPGLFRAAAESLNNAGGSLVLIGPEAAWANELAAQMTNVHLLGSRTPEQVPAYLRHADIGLMLYDRTRQEIYVGQNPLKLYEYAAAGLPVLSTPHDEYQYLDPPARVVSNAEEVTKLLPELLRNRKALSQQALDFVSQRSWQSIYERAAAIIDSTARS